MGRTVVIFIEESIFEQPDFYLVLKSHLSEYADQSVEFLVDESTMKMKTSDLTYFTVSSYLTLLKKIGKLTPINTKYYLDGSALQVYFQTSAANCIKKIFVQKETVFRAFSPLFGGGDVGLLRYKDGKLIPWLVQAVQYVKPFAIDDQQEAKYLNQVETDEIDTVFSPRYGYLKLDKSHKLAGGEGACYSTYRNLFCKIFNQKHLTYTNLKKLQTMLDMDVYNPYIAWPLDLLFYRNNFVGYVMPKVEGAQNLTQLRENGFCFSDGEPPLKPSDRVHICINLLKNIEYLHKKNIIIGDLKDDNILVNDKLEVFIIDSGSFQVADYACDVFTKGWTDKKYQKGDLDEHLRVLEDDYYPINRMLFELLILKSPHYKVDNPELDEEDTKTFEFPINLDEITKRFPGKYPNAYLNWIFLTPRSRECFYYYFANPDNRVVTYVSDWFPVLDELFNFYKKNNK